MRCQEGKGLIDLSERQDIDSLDIEGTHTLVMGGYWAEGMVCLAWAHKQASLNMQWLILWIGDANFYHCWFVDSICDLICKTRNNPANKNIRYI